MKRKLVYIQTIGCQMNVYDSDQMVERLARIGYSRTEQLESADLIILNTCSVREKAEQKAFSFLGRLAGLKRKKRRLIIGVGGCVAQQEGEKILRRVPHVDLVFGTRMLDRLPDMVTAVDEKRCRLVALDLDRTPAELPMRETQTATDKPSRFVTIMRGCDNFCTYCVVPYVRGRETSRPPDRILSEIRGLVAGGVREITLLGQNVNSYGKKEGLYSFPRLLEDINEIDGLWRIRFTTSHPKDLSDELIDAFGRLDKLCHHIHLPVQSGANRILERMKRRYTRESYLEKIDKLRTVCPNIALSSDFIVGFPGETAADFQETLSLIQTVQYDSLFAFVYSDRPFTPSARLSGKVPDGEKKARLQTLLDLQAEFTARKNQAVVGQVVTVLVEGKRRPPAAVEDGAASEMQQWSGRCSANKIVNFPVDVFGDAFGGDLNGTLVNVRIERALAHSLWGRPVPQEND